MTPFFRLGTCAIAASILVAIAPVWHGLAAGSVKSVMVGASLPGGLDSADGIRAFEKISGRELDIANVAMPWADQNGFLSFGVSLPWVEAVSNHGTLPMITWEPMIGPSGDVPDTAPLQDSCPAQIASASSSSAIIRYITQYARDVAAYRKPVLIRMMHEMNFVGWYWSVGENPWCGKVTPASFKAAWRRIATIFKDQGAANAQFVWCVNWTSYGMTGFGNLYPGDQYVSYAAIDGYNWGGAHWMAFDDIFAAPYATIVKHSKRPILITEWASAEDNSSKQTTKAKWITQSFDAILGPNYPKIAGLVWFEQEVPDEPAWPITSSKAAQDAYAAAMLKKRR